MLKIAQQELQQLWHHQSLWIMPMVLGALLLIILGMMTAGSPSVHYTIIDFLPLLWIFMILSSIEQGLPLFQQGSLFLFYATLVESLEVVYQIQLAFLSLFLWVGLGFLALISMLLFDFSCVFLGAQLLVLVLLIPSCLALGHLIKSMLPNTGQGSLLLSFLLFPLYIPLLLLSALTLQAVELNEPFLPYCALLMAIQLILWVCIPPLLLFSMRLKL